MKCISIRGADTLFEKYKGGPRLKGEDVLCHTCVKQKCNIIRTKQKIADDEKLFNNTKKVLNLQDGDAFWVGKSSMRSWRRLVLEQLSENGDNSNMDKSITASDTLAGTDSSTANEYPAVANDDTSTDQNVSKSCDDVSKLAIKEEKPEKKSTDEDDEENCNLLFNEDVLCEKHGSLDPDESCRKLVPRVIWQRLRDYFPECPEFPRGSPVCDLCCALNHEENQALDYNKQLAAEQRSGLSDLLNDRKRPSDLRNPTEVFVVSSSFVEEWKKFVRDPLKRCPVTEILNCTLLCQHGGFLYPPKQNGLDPASNENVVYLWPEEWAKVCQYFSIDFEISIVKYEEGGQTWFVTSPVSCDECVANRLNQRHREQFQFTDAVLYIRKISKEQNGKMNSLSDDKNKEDPDYNLPDNSANRDNTEEPPEKMPRYDEMARRKSQRHRKVRGEKEVRISSTNTLKELKLEIMKQFAVPPFDQNLSICGKLLVDDAATLESLEIEPGSIIMLQADEPLEDALELQDMIHVSSGPESGFKGTGLLGACK
ncbi:hypothetical protein KUTeg_020393 [Tegillarca granosa]|uniref:Ubiquitin-like domain-containing protein n=1 Tax=Tegillarca granosa TaxID=220873 RepID=A0ABQ9EC51_TEGGR|nr:hypothetical protein KUTeg_020393 [Tegillarca granosa]